MSAPTVTGRTLPRLERDARQAADRRDSAIRRGAPIDEVLARERDLAAAERRLVVGRLEAAGW